MGIRPQNGSGGCTAALAPSLGPASILSGFGRARLGFLMRAYVPPSASDKMRHVLIGVSCRVVSHPVASGVRPSAPGAWDLPSATGSLARRSSELLNRPCPCLLRRHPPPVVNV